MHAVNLNNVYLLFSDANFFLSSSQFSFSACTEVHFQVSKQSYKICWTKGLFAPGIHFSGSASQLQLRKCNQLIKHS